MTAGVCVWGCVRVSVCVCVSRGLKVGLAKHYALQCARHMWVSPMGIAKKDDGQWMTLRT
jgi:hypothetical protein